MPKFNLIASGGLDVDTDINSIEKGDYNSARNIVTSPSKGGGGSTVKILESIKDVGMDAIAGAASNTYTLGQADIGAVITVTASYTDTSGFAKSVTSAATANITNINNSVTGTVVITGTATQGATLTLNHTLADADGLGTITYQWKRDGVAISGATATTYTLVQSDVGAAITVTASYTDALGTTESVTSAATASITNINDPVTGTVVISGTAAQGLTLTASHTLADVDGLGTITYQWKRDGVAISGATATTYTLVLDDVGTVITITASYTDALGTTESVTSAATTAVIANNTPTGTVVISGTATQGAMLTASNTLADVDGLGTITYQWKRGGVAISGATATTYTLIQSDVGAAITVTASYTDDLGTTESVTSAATASITSSNNTPTGTVVISGTATQGAMLTASNTLADVDGLGTITYQWKRGGVAISGATATTYTLVQSDVGAAITVTASYTDALGNPESVTSAATASITNINDPVTGTVVISGTAAQGLTLTASHTLDDADGLGTITYQWKRDGVAISEATATTYTLVLDDVGTVITITASYTDALGTTESVTSAATGVVTSPATGIVSISGTTIQGEILTASNTLTDVDGAVTYQWNRNKATIAGTIKASFVHPDGTIYLLYRTDATNASIYKIPATIDNKTTVITYAHSVSSDFKPNLKMLGTSLIWNYHGSGTVLSWDTTRANVFTIDVPSLLLAKSAPQNVLAVSKTVTTDAGVELLEKSDVQFVCRYIFDTGEVSTLGNISSMFKGEKDTASYTLTYALTGRPTYATKLETFVRSGESGTWRRIDTSDISGGTLAAITWKGDIYETLSRLESEPQFSAIPYNVKHLEVGVDRLWLANFEDDYPNDATGTMAITVTNGYTLPTEGGTIKNYFGADTTDAGIKSAENGTFYKPFPNNSTYAGGVIFVDSAGKTRGIEYPFSFQTGNFAGPFAPVFVLTQTGSAKPSWATGMQLCLSKNLTKAATYEGFANSLYFELDFDGVLKKKLSITESDLQKVERLVVDITGMYKAGLVYSFNPGDRIVLNCPDGTTGVTDGDGSITGVYRKLEMEVIGANGDVLYVEWIGGACLNDGIPDATKLYFEVFTPKQQNEEESLRLYGIGPIIDISSSIPASITDYTIGDMVFSKFEMSTYIDQLLYKGLARSVPAIILADATSIVENNKASGDVAVLGTASSVLSTSTVVKKITISADVIGATNNDELTIAGGNTVIRGFYDGQCTITLAFNFQIRRVISGNTDGAIVGFKIFTYLEKTPFDIAANTYGIPVQIGTKTLIHTSNPSDVTLDDTSGAFVPTSVDFEFLSADSILSSGDLLKAVFEIQVTSTDRTIAAASIELKELSGVTNTITMTIVGDRTEPVDQYSDRTAVDVSASKVPFVVRATSNNRTNEWSFSGGKPYLKAVDNFSVRRTNAFRPSGNVINGTSINNMSQFLASDTQEVPQENGDIMSLQRASRLQGEGDMLLAICRNETSYILLGEDISTQSDNSGFGALTGGIVGSIRNIGEKTGIQAKESVYNMDGVIYWWDNFRNQVVEFKKGAKIISDNKVKSYFVGKSGTAKFAFDPFYKLLFVNVGGNDCMGYDTAKGQWIGEFDIDFDIAEHYGERCLFFDAGKIYRSLENASGNKVGEFFGTPYDAYITMTANTIVPIIPKIVRVDHSMDVIDFTQPNFVKASVLDINITNENSQETDIKEVNFLLEDNKLYGQVLRDINSVGGIISGVHIKGYNNNFKITLKDNTQSNRIFGLEVEFDKVSGH
jgi:hypothetical protein